MKNIHSLCLSAVVAGAGSILAPGIACADNVFVSNNGNNTVEEISGGVTSAFITTDLDSPTGIAIDGGNVFVANNGSGIDTGYIAEFSLATGAFEQNYSTGEVGPRGLAFDSAGNLYVADQTTGTIVEIPVGGGTGTVIASGLSFPNGVAFNDGTLYATEGAGDSIDTITGGVVTQLVTGLDSPNGLTFDSAGDLFVVDHGSSSVLEYTSAGVPVGVPPFIAQLSAQGPKTIAIDSAGDFYVTDNGDSTVTEYGSTGNLIATFDNGAFNGPCFVAIDVVPEPTTCLLLIAGLGLLFFMYRRKAAPVARVTVK
jgi:sugar lactone lactonase YvrE